MSNIARLALALAGAAAVSALAPALGLAGQPVVHEHVNFTSDPYADDLCGIGVTGVDRVVETFRVDASRAFIDNANITTTYTAANGKSVEFHQAGASKGTALVDNGDGTMTGVFEISGNSPLVKIPNGPVLGHSTGKATIVFTFDAATGDFISFQIIRDTGLPKGGAGACDAIVAYLLGP